MKKCCNWLRLRLRSWVVVDENLPTPTPTSTPIKTTDSGRLRLRLQLRLRSPGSYCEYFEWSYELSYFWRSWSYFECSYQGQSFDISPPVSSNIDKWLQALFHSPLWDIAQVERPLNPGDQFTLFSPKHFLQFFSKSVVNVVSSEDRHAENNVTGFCQRGFLAHKVDQCLRIYFFNIKRLWKDL